MKKNFENLYEKFGGTHREIAGYRIPDVELPKQKNYEIGKYGHLYLDFIKKHRRGTYTTLLTENKLNARLHEIDLEATAMLERLITQLAAQRGVDEELKERDMLC